MVALFFNFWGALHTVFHSGYTMLHFYQQYTGFQFSIMLSKINQSQRDKNCVFPIYEVFKTVILIEAKKWNGGSQEMGR